MQFTDVSTICCPNKSIYPTLSSVYQMVAAFYLISNHRASLLPFIVSSLWLWVRAASPYDLF